MKRRPLLLLVGAELARLCRTPAFSVPTFLLPALFLLLFGMPPLGQTIDGADATQYLLVSFSTFSVMSVGMFAFGVSVAVERECGWNKLMRLAPLPIGLHLLSKLILSVLFAAACIGVLLLVVSFGAQHAITASLLVTLFAFVLPGVVPFSALGLAIGYLFPANAASVIANVVFLSLACASGLFVPLASLPLLVQRLATSLPSFYLAALGWNRLAGNSPKQTAAGIAILLGFTAIFLLLACWAYHREESREFG